MNPIRATKTIEQLAADIRAAVAPDAAYGATLDHIHDALIEVDGQHRPIGPLRVAFVNGRFALVLPAGPVETAP